MFDIQKASLEETKSVAYDTLVQIEQLQKNLQILNQAIAQKSQQQAEKKEDVKKDKPKAE